MCKRTLKVHFLFLPESIQKHDTRDQNGDSEEHRENGGHNQQIANWKKSNEIRNSFENCFSLTVWISDIDKIEADDIVTGMIGARGRLVEAINVKAWGYSCPNAQKLEENENY